MALVEDIKCPSQFLDCFEGPDSTQMRFHVHVSVIARWTFFALHANVECFIKKCVIWNTPAVGLPVGLGNSFNVVFLPKLE